jgi:hypothetical protein
MGWFTDKLKGKLHLDKEEEIGVPDKAGENSQEDATPSASRTSATKDEVARSEQIRPAVETHSEELASAPVTAKVDAEPKEIGRHEAPAPVTVAQDVSKDSVLAAVATETGDAGNQVEEAREIEVSAPAHAITEFNTTLSHSRQSSSDTITPGRPGKNTSAVTEAPLSKTVSMIAEAEVDSGSKIVASPVLSDETTPKASRHPIVVDTAPSRNLSQEAFDALDSDVQAQLRTLLPDLCSSQASISIEAEISSMTAIVKSKQDDCEKKFWKIKIFGQDVVIRDYVKASVDIIEKAGDVAINFAPAPGSIVWSGVKTLMQVRGL